MTTLPWALEPASPDLFHLHAAIGDHAGAASTPSAQPLQLQCADGVALAAHWHRPPHNAPHAVAVVHAATGVPQGFYRGFAQWLASRGYAVLTYDYRGIGLSRRGPIRAETAAMRTWAQQDMSAALAEASAMRTTPQGQRLPLLHVGHSFGGNALGLAKDFEQADAVLTVASQSGDWRLWPGVHRGMTWLFFHVMLPAIAHTFGHAPSWALGSGSAQPLPKQVALEWARWGRRRGFLFTDPTLPEAHHLRRYTGVVHIWNVSDDWTYGPPGAVNGLAAQFSNARVTRHTLAPADIGFKHIGHFGLFRREVGALAWPRLIDPIEAVVPALRPRQ
jgi:predicted alpha/beta hydrolase